MSKLYAVALALLVLAVPAMAQTVITGPYDQDVDVTINVAEFGEIYHAPGDVELTMTDGGSWFGLMKNMFVNGNVNFDVYLTAQDSANIPNNVFVDIVVNSLPFDGHWALQSSSGNYRMYCQDGNVWDYRNGSNSAWVRFTNAGTPANTKVFSYTNDAASGTAVAEEVPVLYSIMASYTPEVATDKVMTAVYTMSVQP